MKVNKRKKSKTTKLACALAMTLLLNSNSASLAEEETDWLTNMRLGTIALKEGKTEQAIKFINKSIKAAEAETNEDLKNKELAISLTQLATLNCQSKEFARAEKLLQRALTYAEKLPAKDRHALVAVLYNSGGCYSDQGMFEKAIQSIERGLKIAKEDENLDKQWTARLLSGLCKIYKKQKNDKMTVETVIRLSKYAPTLKYKVNLLNNSTYSFIMEDKDEPAEKLLKEALSVLDKAKDSNKDKADLYDMICLNLKSVLMHQDKFSEAEELYLRLLKKCETPDTTYSTSLDSTLCSLAQIYERKKEYTKAESYYKKAIEASKSKSKENKPEAYILKWYAGLLKKGERDVEAAQMELQANFIEKAEKEKSAASKSEISKSKPEEKKANNEHLMKGLSYFSQKKYKEAIIELNKALEISPDSEKALYVRALTFSTMRKHKEAIKDYDQLLKSGGPNAEHYNNRALNYFSIGKEKEALRDFNESLLLDPEYTFAYLNRAKLYMTSEQFEKAANDLSEVIKRKPEFAIAYCNRAIAYEILGKHEEAEKDFDKAKECGIEEKFIAQQRGAALLGQRKFKEAIEVLNKSIEKDKNFAYAYFIRSSAKLCLKQYKSALDDCKKGLKIEPKNKSAHLIKAKLNYCLKDYAQSLEDINKYINMRPQDSQGYILRSGLYSKKKNWQSALKDASKAIELTPKRYMAFCRRGEAYFGIGKSEEALTSFNRAIELDSIKQDDGEIFWKRAKVYDKLGKPALAKKDREEAEKRGYKPEK